MLKVGEIIERLKQLDPESDFYVEVDLYNDVPPSLQDWERGAVRFTVEAIDAYKFGVFPRLKYHKW